MTAHSNSKTTIDTDDLSARRWGRLRSLAVLAAGSLVGAVVPVMWAAPARAASTTMYVAAGGTDSGDCSSPSAPCATVSYALTRGAAGATIDVSGTIMDRFTVGYAVTITGANAPAASPAVIDGGGGGTVVTDHADGLTLDHLVIQNGAAELGGGIFSDTTGQLTVSNTTVTANTAVSGGGLYLKNGGTATVTGSVISGNTATGSTAGSGANQFNWGPGGGGVFLAHNNILYMDSTTMSANHAPNGRGGALMSADQSAGIRVRYSTLSGNTSGDEGGAIVNGSGQIIRSTLEGNTSGTHGGAVAVEGGLAYVFQATIADNSSTGTGAGIFAYGQAEVIATILDHNTPNNCVGNTGNGEYDIDSDGTCLEPSFGLNISNVDPQLGPLQDNGGPTFTMLPSNSSVAINQIKPNFNTNPNLAPYCPRTDQRGFAGPSGWAKCTIGAVEATQLVVTSTAGAMPLALTIAGGFGNGPVTFTAADGTATGCTVSASAPATLSAAAPGTCSVTATKAADGPIPQISSMATTVTLAPAPKTLYVAQGGSDGSDCTVSTNPCASVGYALGQGGPGSTINVIGTVAGGFTTTAPVTITGVGAPADRPAVIDGTGDGSAVTNKSDGVVLDHLTIQNGGIPGGASLGAGIYSKTSGNFTLSNSVVIANDAGNGTGGGLFLADGTTTITNSSISANKATTGGGLELLGGTTHISNSTISANTTSAVAGNGGGGIYADANAILYIATSTLSGNKAPGSEGGAINSVNTSVGILVSDSTITDNHASGWGGGIANGSGQIVRSTVTANSSGSGGGGVYVLPGGVVRVIQSTVAGNAVTQPRPGAGILAQTPDGVAKISASILGTNTESDGTASACSGSISDIGYNVGADSTCPFTAATDADNVDPQLGVLQDNGGPTMTMMPAATSPAVNRVPPGTTLDSYQACPRTDQRGVSGPISTTNCTVGAVEGVAPLSVSSTAGTFGTPLTLTTSGGSGTGAVTFTAADGTATACTVSGLAPFTLTSSTAGTCTVTATKAADATHGAETSPQATVTFARAAQAALTVTSTAGTFATPLTLNTSGGSGTGAVTFTAVDGTATACIVSGSAPFTLTSSTAGTCTVTAAQAGDANYLPASSPATTVTFAELTQTALTVTSTSGTFGTPLTLTTSGGSGTGAVTYTTDNGTATGCTVSGSAPYTLSASSAGTCSVTATKADDGTYLATSSAATTVTIAQAAQAALTVTSTSGTFATPLTLTTSGGSGTGAVTFTAANGTATGCTVSTTAPFTLSTTSAGTCTVTASKAADPSYQAASSPASTVTLAPAAQSAISITSTTGTYLSPLTLTTSGGSGTGAVTYAVANGTAPGCSVTATAPYQLTSTGAGTCTVTATKAADGNYVAASSPATTVTLMKAHQPALTVTSTSGTYLTALTLATSGGGGTGAVTYVAVNGSATGCTVSSSTPYQLTTTSAGTCTVTASKAGDANYLAASSAATTVTLSKAKQPALTVTSTSGTYLTPLTLTTSGGAGTGAVTYKAVNGTAPGCAISTTTPYKLTTTGAGTCTVTATKAADSNYGAASSPATTVTVAKAAQPTLTLTSTSGTYLTPLTLTTSGGAGTGVVTYATVNGTATGCKVSTSTPHQLTTTSAGTCNVAAAKSGDANYLPTNSLSATVTLAKAAQTPLAVTSTQGVAGTPLTLTTSGGSGTGTVTYVAANGTATGCTVTTSTPYRLTTTGTGTCAVTATNSGDGNFLPASSPATTVTFGQPQAALTVTSTNGTYATPLTLTTTGGSGTGAVTYVAANGTASGCTVSATTPYTLNTTSAGTCTVTATKAADSTYGPVSSAPATVTIAKAAQAQLVVTSTTGVFGTPRTLTTSGGSGSGAVTYAVTNGTATGCTISSSTPYTLTSSSIGTCTVTATKAGDSGYLPASSAPTAVRLANQQATLTITSTSGNYGTPLTLTTSGGSGTGAVTYTVTNGTATGCAISTATPFQLTASSKGTCLVTATKAADATYLATSSAQTKVTLH